MSRMYALGPKGTYGHEAAVLFRQCQPRYAHHRICYQNSNVDILRAVARADDAIGVVPIENSSAGLVTEVIRYWMSQDGQQFLTVIGEVGLPIRHCLLAHPDIEEISSSQAVISHPQALTQCQTNLSRLKLKIERPALSTAVAAKYVAEFGSHEAVVAIASRFAAQRYGLRVLERNLQDANANLTRFHIVSRIPTQKRETDVKTAILFWLPDEPGALYGAIEPIKSAKANMSSIHSIPLGEKGRFAFYLEFEGHRQTRRTAAVLTLIEGNTERLVVLGSFPAFN